MRVRRVFRIALAVASRPVALPVREFADHDILQVCIPGILGPRLEDDVGIDVLRAGRAGGNGRRAVGQEGNVGPGDRVQRFPRAILVLDALGAEDEGIVVAEVDLDVRLLVRPGHA